MSKTILVSDVGFLYFLAARCPCASRGPAPHRLEADPRVCHVYKTVEVEVASQLRIPHLRQRSVMSSASDKTVDDCSIPCSGR